MFSLTFDKLKGEPLPALYDSIQGADLGLYDSLPKILVMCMGAILILAGMLYRSNESEAKEFIIGLSGVSACAALTFLALYF